MRRKQSQDPKEPPAENFGIWCEQLISELVQLHFCQIIYIHIFILNKGTLAYFCISSCFSYCNTLFQKCINRSQMFTELSGQTCNTNHEKRQHSWYFRLLTQASCSLQNWFKALNLLHGLLAYLIFLFWMNQYVKEDFYTEDVFVLEVTKLLMQKQQTWSKCIFFFPMFF